MVASKLSAGIIRFMFLYARCLGVICFRFRNQKDKVTVIEETWSRPWWKWLTVILRLVPLCTYVYTYGSWILSRKVFVDQLLHLSRLVLSIPCYTSMIYLNIFHGSNVSKLINRYLDIFRRVKHQANRKKESFGGQQEFLLILVCLGCQIHEIVLLFGIFHWVINLKKMIVLVSHTYVIFASTTIIRISFFWYLSLGVLYANLNENLQRECLRSKINKTQRLKKSMSLVREISCVVSSLQDISNAHLFLSEAQMLLQMVVISFNMIIDLRFSEFRLWIWFVKITIDLLILSLATQEVSNQFRSLRELTLDIFFVDKSKDWMKTVEIFVTHLNLNKFRVRPCGLFDFSNEQFLVIVSGMVSYLVFIVQC
uniref:Gustatory receptor n=1 Tax=Drosophila rhopaloa TaxID=1041015 RepID=A0A6P4FM84_DRORH